MKTKTTILNAKPLIKGDKFVVADGEFSDCLKYDVADRNHSISVDACGYPDEQWHVDLPEGCDPMHSGLNNIVFEVFTIGFSDGDHEIVSFSYIDDGKIYRHRCTDTGYCEWSIYDMEHNPIYINKNGVETFYTYNDDNKLVSMRRSDGYTETVNSKTGKKKIDFIIPEQLKVVRSTLFRERDEIDYYDQKIGVTRISYDEYRGPMFRLTIMGGNMTIAQVYMEDGKVMVDVDVRNEDLVPSGEARQEISNDCIAGSVRVAISMAMTDAMLKRQKYA